MGVWGPGVCSPAVSAHVRARTLWQGRWGTVPKGVRGREEGGEGGGGGGGIRVRGLSCSIEHAQAFLSFLLSLENYEKLLGNLPLGPTAMEDILHIDVCALAPRRDSFTSFAIPGRFFRRCFCVLPSHPFV